MDLKEKAEELLETLWIRTEEKKETSIPLDDPEVGERDVVEQLMAADYISVSDGGSR